MTAYERGKYNPYASVPDDFTGSQKFDFEKGQYDAKYGTNSYQYDTGYPTPPANWGGAIMQFWGYTIFGKTVVILMLEIFFNGFIVGLLTWREGPHTHPGLISMACLTVGAALYFAIFWKLRKNYLVCFAIMLAVGYVSYKAIADDVKKSNAMERRYSY